MRVYAVLLSVVLVVVSGCAALRRGGHQPRLVWEGEGAPAARTLAESARWLAQRGPGSRAGTWGYSRNASYQILESEVAERPHVHVEHDLTVVLLRGSGVLFVEKRRYELVAGDVLHIRRGRPHHFHPTAKFTTGLAIFTPRLDGPPGSDYRPVVE